MEGEYKHKQACAECTCGNAWGTEGLKRHPHMPHLNGSRRIKASAFELSNMGGIVVFG